MTLILCVKITCINYICFTLICECKFLNTWRKRSMIETVRYRVSCNRWNLWWTWHNQSIKIARIFPVISYPSRNFDFTGYFFWNKDQNVSLKTHLHTLLILKIHFNNSDHSMCRFQKIIQFKQSLHILELPNNFSLTVVHILSNFRNCKQRKEIKPTSNSFIYW